MGSEAAGPGDLPPMDSLKNLGRCDLPAGEFWVNGHFNFPGGYNANPSMRLNLKQTASAAHIYGRPQAMAESFTSRSATGRIGRCRRPTSSPTSIPPSARGSTPSCCTRRPASRPRTASPATNSAPASIWNANSTWWSNPRPSSRTLRGASTCFSRASSPPMSVMNSATNPGHRAAQSRGPGSRPRL